ncbi:hypothetical protein RFI_18549 [Reticulomyxa filosa]|uniref:Uncharacterized protein n=1 Tax=Reticulomyxa filosa TaxID=46433 RepID=X6MXY6_RETFI|nr:hypothetical protein RFI_18549 [Reticulomyxa filosa]|eukprot:ETO18706.1 hypothetical protein RFI_18549 [Reticulomyxa filosa]
MDWDKWRDTNVSELADRYAKQWCSNSLDDKSANKLQWMKVQITLEAIKHVIHACILEKCQVSAELISQTVINLDVTSPTTTHRNDEHIFSVIKTLQKLIQHFHEKYESDEDWDALQSELKLLEAFPPSNELDTSSTFHCIVSQQNARTVKRRRIYLYCPKCTKHKQRRTRAISFPSIIEDIPWLYWSDFQVSASDNSFCSIFSRKKRIMDVDIYNALNAIIIEEKTLMSLSGSKNYSAIILEHLMTEVKDEDSFCFVTSVFKDLKSQLQSESTETKTVLNNTLSNLDHLNPTIQNVYQALFACTLSKEGKWLSPKQLFVTVNKIAKNRSPEQLSQPVIDTLFHNLVSFDDTKSFGMYSGRNKVNFSASDKFMLIPCFNYLAFSKSLQKQKTSRADQFLQKIHVQASHVQSMTEADFIEVLITDLHLRKNPDFSPTIRIENHLLDFLWCDGKHTSLTKGVMDVLLDINHCDKDKLNPWTHLWKIEKCWLVFQSLFQTQFDDWNKFIHALQLCVNDFAVIADRMLKGFQTTNFQNLVSHTSTTMTEFVHFMQYQKAMLCVLCTRLYIYVHIMFVNISFFFFILNPSSQKNKTTRFFFFFFFLKNSKIEIKQMERQTKHYRYY